MSNRRLIPLCICAILALASAAPPTSLAALGGGSAFNELTEGQTQTETTPTATATTSSTAETTSNSSSVLVLVLGAAVFEMRFRDFLAAVFAGRFVRFLVLSLLTLWFGPQIVGLIGTVFRQHIYWVLGVIILGVSLWLVMLLRRRRKSEARS